METALPSLRPRPLQQAPPICPGLKSERGTNPITFTAPKSASSLCMYRSWSRSLEFSGPQPAGGCPFVGEGVPLALDARVIRVEGLADADHLQAGLLSQLLHQRRDLLHRLAVDAFLAYGPVKVFGHYSGHRARARVHVYYNPRVPSGEVRHFAFHELPGAAGRGRIPAEAEAEALQLLHVATKPVMEDAGQKAARSPARSHGYLSVVRKVSWRAGLSSDFRFWDRGRPGEFCFRGHGERRVLATHVAGGRVESGVVTRSSGRERGAPEAEGRPRRQ